ncbi:MAG: [FeFe] hydrogenase H-cluster radical SAM maturase HydG [candidate division FCPU426 bacterium]
MPKTDAEKAEVGDPTPPQIGDPRSPQVGDIISEPAIWEMLESARQAGPEHARALVARARDCKGLTPEETAVLLHQDRQPEILADIMAAAREVKEKIYGHRQVFFAPLYISNYCANNCLYCAYRSENRELPRRRLSLSDITDQVRSLEEQGHKRLLLVAGEADPFENVLEALRTIYATRTRQGEIRRVNVNIAPPTVGQFRALKQVGIGTYQCFQETYHQETYRRMHPSGPKADYAWRLTVMDRALQAGVDDVSTGVLLGLFDYRFDVTALIVHGQYLERRYRVGPHAVSVPRLQVAHGTPLCDESGLEGHPHRLTDDQFKLVVAVLRLALPYAGLILTTREHPRLRDELLLAGVSQLSAGSHTEVGGYTGSERSAAGQFEIADIRSLDETVRSVLEAGQVPSFCTACYRCGRTGEHIMELIKPGDIQAYCLPNALLTLKEYLLDYASPETRRLGEERLAQWLGRLPQSSREATETRLRRLEGGERDLFF